MNDRGMVATAGSWPGGGETVQKLEYDGTIGALYWIFIKNLLLNIITLSFYRFWGKTNIRRYAWSHTCLLYTSPSPRDRQKSRMPSSA